MGNDEAPRRTADGNPGDQQDQEQGRTDRRAMTVWSRTLGKIANNYASSTRFPATAAVV
jgi:hypothetical protein